MSVSVPAPMPKSGFLEWCSRAWRAIHLAIQVLLIVRFSLLVPTILVLALLVSVQLADMLRALGEDPRIGQTIALMFASAFAGLLVWYTARTMLRFRFKANPASAADCYPTFKRHLPRILGVLVPGALAVRIATLAPSSTAPTAVWMVAAALAATTVALGLFVFARRWLAQRPVLRGLARQESAEPRDLERFTQLDPLTRRIFRALIVANIASMLLYIFAPIYVIGAPALLLLSLGLTTATGGMLVYAGNHYQIPVITLLAIWTAICSFWNDNHAVRATAEMKSHGVFARAGAPPTDTLKPSPLASQTFDSYFKGWWQELASQYPAGHTVPVFVVAAEGGGIRAAYWTAQILARLEDATAQAAVPFSRHVAAMSGVSGGSLGAATFSAIVARRASGVGHDETLSRQSEVDAVLGRDFLSPTLGTALFPDLLQRFLPFPLLNDRAIALEQSWETAWDEVHPDDERRFTRAFHDLWAENPHAVPLLFLNSTVVESGQRAIVHPLATRTPKGDDTFLDTLQIGRVIGTELPLSTAVHLSARFTYVSPAGLIDAGGEGRHRWLRLVDGGYFDNSGAVTAHELVRAIMKADAALDTGRRMRVIFLHIPNDPAAPGARDLDPRVAPGGEAWLGEALSPVRALLATRDARGQQAVRFLKRSNDYFSFPLYRDGAALPLGWVLSKEVRAQIRRQVSVCPKRAQANCAATKIEQVLKTLVEAGKDETLPRA